MEPVEVVTIREVAEALRVSEATAYRLVHDGDLQSMRVRGQLRVFASSLAEYMTPHPRSVTA